MAPRFLLGCYEIPGYGGASTAAYRLFETMRREGIDASFVNLIDEQDADYYRYTFGEDFGNPRKLPGVHNYMVRPPLSRPQPELSALIRELAPTVLLGVGFIAALLMKHSCPHHKVIFMTTGSAALKEAIERNEVKDFLTQQRIIEAARSRPITAANDEKHAVELADLIIVHSEMTMALYRYYYWPYAGKIYSTALWRAECIYNEAKEYSRFAMSFMDRDIDALFVASSWSRPEKNYPLVKRIARQLRGRSVHIVGGVVNRLPQATHHGLLVRRDEVFKLMGRAKTVVCPSLHDAAPGILFEASAMGCNVIASKNCGNWMICHEQLLVDPFTPAGFLEKTVLSLSTKFEDNIDHFLRTDSRRQLLEVMSVI